LIEPILFSKRTIRDCSAKLVVSIDESTIQRRR
jgi:hypothetical protein